MDDHKLLLLEEALYITFGKTNPRVSVEHNDCLLIKITEHRLIHIGVVLKSWSKALNLKPFGYKFVFKLTYQKLCFCMKTSIH